MADSHSLTLRVPEDVHTRLMAAAERSGVAKSVWVLEAVMWALEEDEKPVGHVPRQITETTPRVTNGRIRMPQGRSFERF
jgi:hypothetical protein